MQTLTRYAIVLWLAGLTCFVAMAFLAAGSDRFPGDEWLATRLQDVDTPFVVEPIEGAEELVELPLWPVIVLVVSVAAVRLLGARAVLVIVVALASRFLVTIIKELVERPRPSPDLVEVANPLSNFSFPSGHAFNAFVLFGLIFYLATCYVTDRYVRLATQVSALLIIAGASLARVHAGLHWPSDIVGGGLLGLLIVSALVAFGESLPGGRLKRPAPAQRD